MIDKNLEERLENIRHKALLSRQNPLDPRGSLDREASERISYKSEIQEARNYLATDKNESVAAINLIAEVGGFEDIPLLKEIVRNRNYLPQCLAAVAGLSVIGGPSAAKVMSEILTNPLELLELRYEALLGLLDLTVGGWDSYLMGTGRIAMPDYLRTMFESLRDDTAIGKEIQKSLLYFD